MEAAKLCRCWWRSRAATAGKVASQARGASTALTAATQVLHLRTPIANAHPSVTPLFQNSAFDAASPYFYARKSSPNLLEVEGCVALLESAPAAMAFPSGMAALSAVLSMLVPGDVLVVSHLMYGCSYRLFDRVKKHQGVKVHVADLSDPKVLHGFPCLRMVLFETPTNPFLRTLPISSIAAEAKAVNKNALVVVDNTWASPLFQQPLEHGADISVHSATKYLSGHSDVMGGFVLSGQADVLAAMQDVRFYAGAVMDPHSAWLLRRSLSTLPLRMKEHVRVTKQLQGTIQSHRHVKYVYLPDVDGRQLLEYGGILFFELAEPVAHRYVDFRDQLRCFRTGTGMACVTSMVAQPYSGSHASMSEEEKAAIGLTPALVRLCFGLEDVEDLRADLCAALDSLG